MISSINITPFVDVVLVLLVIFMVTAPLLVKEVIDINLPKTQTGDGKKVQTLGISVSREGTIFLNGIVVSEAEFKSTVLETLGTEPDVQAIVAADQEVLYKHVVRAIDLLKTMGVNRFAVQIEKNEDSVKTETTEKVDAL